MSDSFSGKRYGWCITRQHDTEQSRGPCPIQVGNNKPCSCPCHDGQTETRPYFSATAKALLGAQKPQQETVEQATLL